MISDDYNSYITNAFEETINTYTNSKNLSNIILNTALLIIKSLNNGNKILIMGNGGSASDASHMAAELIGRFQVERRPLPAIALTTDTSLITAVANDYGYDQIFVRQCMALAKPGDIILAISTSGRSRNVIEAIRQCKKIGSIIIIGLTGNQDGEFSAMTDISIKVPSEKTSLIQEVHRTIIHIICKIIDDHYASV